MVTMTEVAKHAKVSVKTVSRVLNSEPHVQEGMKDRVQKAINALGYVPSVSARRLRSNRSYNIHLVAEASRSNYVSSVQFGASCLCQSVGYALTISLVPDEVGRKRADFEQWVKSMSLTGKPDGVILLPPLTNSALINEVLSDAGIAVARVGSANISDSNWTVRVSDRDGAFVATKHLLELGHTKIGFIKGKDDQIASFERYDGYLSALNSHGVSLQPDFVTDGSFTFESGLACAETLLSTSDRPTAIFASNDDMAAGVIVAALRRGLLLPKELSVVGFDDSEIASKTWPALTTIRQPIHELGEVAARSLIDNAATSGIQREDIVLDFELVVRNSTAMH